MVGWVDFLLMTHIFGHTANNEATLNNLINTDMTHLKKWSTISLVKFNLNKTDIMIFNVNGAGCKLSFELEETTLGPVNLHNNLGFIFSSDCNWTKNVDKLIESATKKSLKIPKGQSETVYRRRIDNTMAKRKTTKAQTTIDKTYI